MRHGFLRLADLLGALVIELQRALDGSTLINRHDYGGVDLGLAVGQADFLTRIQHAALTVGDGVMRRRCTDRTAGQRRGIAETCITQNGLFVGDGNGNGCRRRQKQLTHALRRFQGKAVLQTVEHLARKLQNLIGLPRTHRIGVHQQADENHQAQGEDDTRHHHDVSLALFRKHGEQQRKRADDGRNQQQHLCGEETRKVVMGATDVSHGST